MVGPRTRGICAGVILVGLVVVGFGLYQQWVAGRSFEVTCGQRAMSPGERCVSTSPVHDGTYDQLRAERLDSVESARATSPTALTIGAVIGAVGVIGLLADALRPGTRPGPAPPGRAADPAWWARRPDDRTEDRTEDRREG